MNVRLLRPILPPILLLSLLLAQSAVAADDERTRAGQLFRAGQAAFAQGDYSAAAQSFEQAHQLLPSGSTLYNAGRAWDEGTEPALAAANYEEALAQVDLSPSQRRHAARRLQDLQAKLIGVRINGPAGFTVLDAAGNARGLPTKVYVAPETKQVTVRSANRATQTLSIAGRAGETLVKTVAPVAATEAVKLAPIAEPQTASLPPTSRPPVSPERAQVPALWGWVGVGVATAAATATTLVGLSFLSKRSEFIDGGRTNAGLREDAVRLGTFTGIGMGLTLVGAGVAVWGFHRSVKPRDVPLSLRLGPQALYVGGRF